MRDKIVCLILVLSASLALAGCGRKKENSRQIEFCLEFLYAYMTPEDDMLYTRDFWEDNISKTLEVREKMGWNVPIREFLHFVLPLRAGSERIDDFRTLYADSLCSRVEGMSMTDAALEMNFWCREQAEFDDEKPGSDSPLGIIKSGYGDCNALSELLVCGLRAIGIPARQVCVVWPHTSGAHSWVEVWVDGGWHHMDGGSPYPKLDLGMISDQGPRVMLANISVFGDYEGPEAILEKTEHSTVISNLRRYAPVKNLGIKVLDSIGKPVPETNVKFYVGKGEYKKTLHTAQTGRNGAVSLETGYGDCAVVAEHNGLCGIQKASACDTSVIITLETNVDDVAQRLKDMKLVPPPKGLVPGTVVHSSEGWDVVVQRVKEADSLRTLRLANQK